MTSEKKVEKAKRKSVRKYFKKNGRWLIPFSTVIMTFIAVISLTYSIYSSKRSFNVQNEMMHRQFIADSTNLRIALNEYKILSRPFVDVSVKTNIVDSHTIDLEISFSNRANVPVLVNDMVIDFYEKKNSPHISYIGVVLTSKQTETKLISIGGIDLNKLGLFSVKAEFHSIFERQKMYSTEGKFHYSSIDHITTLVDMDTNIDK